jgi:hypothetical protein
MSTPPLNQKKVSDVPHPSDTGSYSQMLGMSLANSPYKDLVKGILAGGTEVAVDQPLVLNSRNECIKDWAKSTVSDALNFSKIK